VSKGEKLTDDVHNGGTQLGLWKCLNTIYKGYCSSSWMYLVGKENITVLSSATSKQLLFDGTTCTGVEVFADGDKTLQFFAKREVILSQGVYESPKLLMLSGIGPKG
jgi:choline dehydrogenase